MRLRTLSAAIAATLAVAGLAGCRTNVGVAATVGDHHISESRVNSFVTPTGALPSVVANAKQANKTVPSPKSQVLQFLVEEQLFERVLAKNGGVPAPATLQSFHDTAAQVLLQTNISGKDLDNALAKGLPGSGIKATFGKTYLRVLELEYALIQKLQVNSLKALVAAIAKAHVSVTVSPRYGTWVAKSLSLNDAAGIPSYLKLQPTPAAASGAN